MKAVICESFGPPENLQIHNLANPIPGANELVITVKAASINYPDTLIIQGKYQLKPDFPFSPGCEVAGIVTSVGADVSNFSVGDRVIAFPGWGGFVEQLKIDSQKVNHLPDGVAFDIGSAFLMAYSTAYHALYDRANLQPGETLLVLGAGGGVGLAAVEIGKAMGAKVIASASSEEKLTVCRDYGADESINYTQQDLKSELRVLIGKRGVDVIYDAVGGRYAEPALRAIAWKGRYLVVGFAAGEIPKFPLNLMLLKGCAIVGVYLGEFARREPENHQDNVRTLLDWLQSEKLSPRIQARYPLEQAPQALRALMERQVVGKIVLVP